MSDTIKRPTIDSIVREVQQNFRTFGDEPAAFALGENVRDVVEFVAARLHSPEREAAVRELVEACQCYIPPSTALERITAALARLDELEGK